MAEQKEFKPRLMRVVDFTAEALVEEANRMPPNYKGQADILRHVAAKLRKSDNPRMVRVCEEQPEKK